MTMVMLAGLIGGLGMFIYGMHLMSEGLKVVAGNKMKYLLEVLTNNRVKAILCGVIVTIMVQSSSTTTVMVVGFVNASLMTLAQAAGIILGSNIGTTLMAQIIAFDITAYAPVFIGIGTFMALFSKKKKARDWGSIVLGFGILFFGINTMSTSVTPLKDDPTFVNMLLTYGKNQWIGLLLATVMTGILQSSGAIIGLVQALAISGVFAGASGTEAIQICIPIIIGSNIGTCVTAILSSIGTSNTAKDAALIHLFVNIFGCVWVMALLNILNAIMPMDPIYQWFVDISGTTINAAGEVVPNVARQIAMAHTVFNVANTIVLFPFVNQIVALVKKILPPEENGKTLQLDDRLLNSPGVALGQVKNEMCRMTSFAGECFMKAVDALINKNDDDIKQVDELEDTIDEFEHGIQEYLTKLGNVNMTQEQNDLMNFYYEASHGLERISDYSVNLTELATSLMDKEASFSDNMKNELTGLCARVQTMISQAGMILDTQDLELCSKVGAEENEVDEITDSLRDNRMKKLHGKSEKVFPTFVFTDALTNIERIADHVNNIADSVVQMDKEKTVNKIEEVIY